ncbi:MAG: hypothetical protein ABI665_07670 [Vicinamibacterales bacterium]
MSLKQLTHAILALSALGVAASASAQTHQMPAGMTHEEHQKQMAKDAELAKRGADAMGFDQALTTHHFILAADGGSIEVTVKNASDTTNLDAIRTHLKEIAGQFAAGDFGKPLMTHGEAPDGVAAMVANKSAISYGFESLPTGGRVRLRTTDAAALDAVHKFLQYQIREHKTGDSLKPGI